MYSEIIPTRKHGMVRERWKRSGISLWAPQWPFYNMKNHPRRTHGEVSHLSVEGCGSQRMWVLPVETVGIDSSEEVRGGEGSEEGKSYFAPITRGPEH